MIFSFGPRGLITYQLLGLKGVTVFVSEALLRAYLDDAIARARPPG